MKKVKSEDEKELILKLPGETIIVGPGTVPTSTASAAHTSIKEIVAGFRKASKMGLFSSAIIGRVNE
jgi:hypothetical protein